MSGRLESNGNARSGPFVFDGARISGRADCISGLLPVASYSVCRRGPHRSRCPFIQTFSAMASSSQGLRTALQILLAVIIVVLAYFLYVSITEPYEVIERQKELTELTRERMIDVRSALVQFEQRNDRFPSSLDSLLIWINQDSTGMAVADSLYGGEFVRDSLLTSPRTGKTFNYALNDTGRVAIYVLKDPDSDDQIGSEIPDVTLLNAASWQ